MIESTLDDPRQILMAQQSQARGEAIAAMKAEGIEYEERMQLLEQVSYPKPLEELLEAAFATYCKGHPWLLGQELSPKSVVRDMFARAMTFSEYVAFYGLNRSEGLVLRYLCDAYRALRLRRAGRGPDRGAADLTAWLGEVVRQTDSSLLDEWEQLTDSDPRPTGPHRGRAAEPGAVGQHPGLHRADPQRDVPPGGAGRPARATPNWARWTPAWDAEAWREALTEYYAEYDRIGIGAAARGRDCSMLTPEPAVAGPTDPGRSGRRPGLGDHGRGRSGRQRRGGEAVSM